MISRWLAALLIAAPASVASLTYAQDKPGAPAPVQAASALPPINPIPADINARYSYAQGVAMGKSMAKQHEIDADQASRGMADGAKGKSDITEAKARVLEIKWIIAQMDKSIAKAEVAKDTELVTVGREQRKLAIAELAKREQTENDLAKTPDLNTYRPVDGFNLTLTGKQIEYDAQGNVTSVVDPEVVSAPWRIELVDGKFTQGLVQTREFGKIRFVKKADAKELTAMVSPEQNADIKLALDSRKGEVLGKSVTLKPDKDSETISNTDQLLVLKRIQPKKPEATDAAPANVVIPADINAQFSYAFGVLFGKQISSENNLDPDQFVKGLNDGAKDLATISNSDSGILEAQWYINRLDKDIAKFELAKDTGQLTIAQEQRKLLQLELARREQSAVQAKLGEEFLKKNKTAEGVKTTESGLQYKVIKEGTGPKPKSTDVFTANYKGSLVTGEIFDQSKPDKPLVLGIDKVIPGWTEGLQLMPAGSKYMFWIPSELGYGDRGSPPTIPSNAMLVFEVELLKTEPAGAAKPGLSNMAPNPNAGSQAKAGEDFLAKNKTAEGVKTTASGLQYKVLKEGTGAKPKATDTVTVNYKGSLITGEVFDQSQAPISFGLNQVIAGWTEGVQLMPVGSKFQFWIPYQLAYGAEGRPPQIPAAAALIFEVELIGISK